MFPIAAKRLHGSLQELVAADLIMEQGQPPRTICSFRHALVQDAAYSSLLRDRRRTLHQRVASGSSMLRLGYPGEAAVPRLLEVSTDYETFLGAPEGHLFHSWALLHERDDAAARGRLQRSFDQLDETRTWVLLPFLMAAAAELCAAHGDTAAARRLPPRARIFAGPDRRALVSTRDRPAGGRVHQR